MRGIRVGLTALSVLAAVGIGAYATTQQASAQASTRMTITMSEYSIMTEVPSAPAGDITFDVVNTGDEVHEMIVIKSDADIKALPMANKDEVDEDKVGEFIGSFEDVQPATSANGTLVLGPGRYILLCNLSKHYGLGMVNTLTIN